MSLRLHNRNEVPPSGFRYLQPETEQWLDAPSWPELLRRVKEHREANMLPVGTGFSDEIEHQLCQNCPPETCEQTEPGEKVTQRGPITFQMALDTIVLFAKWFTKFGGERASAEQTESRSATCVQCPYNQQFAACRPCSWGALRDAAKFLVGGQETKYDNRLNGCTICGCSLRAKVRLPAPLLQKFAADKLDEFPAFCWMQKERVA